MITNKRTTIEWDTYLAIQYAEGFGIGAGATADEQIEAWAYLIDTGTCWKLQGWFGRNAQALLHGEFITKDGDNVTIDWDQLSNEEEDE